MQHLALYNEQYKTLYESFDVLIKTKNYSGDKNTQYQSSIKEFLHFSETKHIRNIHEIKAAHINDYYQYLTERPNQRRTGGLSPSSIQHQLFSLRLFFDYLLDTGTITNTPAYFSKFGNNTYTPRNITTPEEIKHIYAQTENTYDKALLALAYGCGMRRSEIVKLNAEDTDLYKGTITVREGKNRKTRIIPLSDTVLKDLKTYYVYERTKNMNHTHAAPTSSFMITDYGKRPTGLALNNRVKELISKTKNWELIKKNITLHSLRHSIATHLIDNGAEIEFVQHFLGHTLLDTTHIYSKRRKQKQKTAEALYRNQLKNE